MNDSIINNRYVLEAVIGEGAMGVVHRAYDRLNREQVAVKRIRVAVDQLKLAISAPITERKNAYLLALTREFRMLSSMRHPNIISVLDYGFDADHRPYFVMDYLPDAHNLQEASANRPVSGKIDLLIQMLQALAYLHRRGILHRDIKLDNVLVTGDTLKLLDFGLSVDRENAHGRAGTLAYMAPETMQHGISVEASDLYSAGVMAYEIFANRPPFAPDDVIGMLSDAPDMSLVDAPDAITTVIARLLQKTPPERYTSAQVVIADLRAATDDLDHSEGVAIRESYLQAAAFVGRDDELKTLRGALGDALDGKGSFWLIGGESGIGKSRLLAELRTYALVEGAQVLSGEATDGASLPYRLWRTIIPQLALTVELTAQEASILCDIAPDILELTGHEPVDIPEAGGEAAQQRLIATLIAILRRVDQPTVLLLEDLHWMNESLTILQQVTPLIREHPLVIIGTYRIEDDANLPEQLPLAQVMRLETLDADEMHRLGATMLGESDYHQDELLALLGQETGGNPLFVVEMLRALAEEAGSLTNVARQTLPLGVFMQGIRRVIEERLKRIPATMQPVLRLASALGREIDTTLLEIHFTRELVRDWLLTASENAIVEVADNRWFFSHAEVRETVLEVLPNDTRQHVHRQAAEALEAVYDDDPAYAALMVEHWHIAGDDEKTFHYARNAAHFAFARGLLEPAKTFATQALDVSHVEIDTDKIIALRLLVAEVEKRTGNYETALTTYRQIVAMSIERNDPLTQARALAHMSWIHLRRSNVNTARDHCLPALRMARESEDAEVLSLVLKNLGFIALNTGDFEDADNYFDRSLEYAREIDKTTEIAALLNARGLTYLIQGDSKEAQRYFTESLTYFERLDDRWNIAVALHNQGAALTNMGEYADAERSLRRALELDQSINDNVGVTYHLSYLTHIAINRTDFDRATRYIEHAEILLKDIDDRKLESSIARAAGWMYLYREEFARAERYFERSLQINIQLEHEPTIIVARVSFGWLWLLQGERDKAMTAFKDNLAPAQDSGDLWTAGEIHNGMGLILHERGEHEQARDHLRQTIALMRPLHGLPLMLEALAIYARTVDPDDAAVWCCWIVTSSSARTLGRRLAQQTLDALDLSRDALNAARERAATLDLDAVFVQIMA